MSETKQSFHRYKYFDFVMASFVTVLLCSNLIGASKVCSIAGFTFGAGILFFPLSYIFGDILTEVYGYSRSRRVVWAGFTAQIFASFMAYVVLAMPPAEGWPNQAALETAFGSTYRIVLASLIAFFAGEFTNSFILAKLKIITKGRFLWVRTVGSTIGGEGVDSLIFYPVAFYGLWQTELVIKVMITNFVLKVLWEVFMTPFTYLIVGFLKRAENEDFYDYKTNFNPFTLKEGQ
ncbi:MAG: queuosine precursor transporter [Acidobacteria bacterium]|nr:queuosine precursor transporter [Acidobacteriota bacterium]